MNTQPSPTPLRYCLQREGEYWLIINSRDEHLVWCRNHWQDRDGREQGRQGHPMRFTSVEAAERYAAKLFGGA
jgi:hypothetical protein